MRNWHETERRKAAERRAKASTAQSTVGISKRPGGGGRGGGWRWGEGGGGLERDGGMGGGEGGRHVQETDVRAWPSSSSNL